MLENKHQQAATNNKDVNKHQQFEACLLFVHKNAC